MSELTREELAELVRDALVRLGGTADEVAQSLRAAGITGERDEACKCPLARYLMRLIPGVTIVAVGDQDVWTFGSGEVSLPGPVSQFVIAFDKGAYPDLVTRSGAS